MFTEQTGGGSAAGPPRLTPPSARRKKSLIFPADGLSVIPGKERERRGREGRGVEGARSPLPVSGHLVHPSLFPWGVRPVRRLGGPPPTSLGRYVCSGSLFLPGSWLSARPVPTSAALAPRGGFPQAASALWWLLWVAARERRTGS